MNTIGNNEKKRIIILYIIAVPILFLFGVLPGHYDYDTQYYMKAADVFFMGNIDCLRTPIYPLFLKFCSIFGNGNLLSSVIIIQSVVYLISIYFFYQLSLYILGPGIMVFLVTLCYVTVPVPAWCGLLMTESLSISGSVVLTYLIVRRLHNRSVVADVSICLISLFLLFLRPTFLVFTAILPVIWLFCMINKKGGQYGLPLFLSLVPIVCFCFYCGRYANTYGKFTSTISYECNTIFNLKRSGLWDPDCLYNKEEKTACEYIDDHWDGAYGSIYNYTTSSGNLQVIDEMCSTMIKHHARDYYLYRLKTALVSLDSHFLTYTCQRRDTPARLFYAFTSFLTFHISFFFLVSFVLCVVVLISIILQKSIPLKVLLMVGICLGYGLGIMVSATDSQGRLLLPVLPHFFIVLGCFTRFLIDFVRRGKESFLQFE